MGSTRPFEHREALGVKNFGHDSLNTLLEGNFIPKSLLPAYESVARDLLKRVEEVYKATPHKNIRMHGDRHPGNMMRRDEMFHIVDLGRLPYGTGSARPVDDARWRPSGMPGPTVRVDGRLSTSSTISTRGEFGTHRTAARPAPDARQRSACAALGRPRLPPQLPVVRQRALLGDQVLALREQLSALNEEPLKLF